MNPHWEAFVTAILEQDKNKLERVLTKRDFSPHVYNNWALRYVADNWDLAKLLLQYKGVLATLARMCGSQLSAEEKKIFDIVKDYTVEPSKEDSPLPLGPIPAISLPSYKASNGLLSKYRFGVDHSLYVSHGKKIKWLPFVASKGILCPFKDLWIRETFPKRYVNKYEAKSSDEKNEYIDDLFIKNRLPSENLDITDEYLRWKRALNFYNMPEEEQEQFEQDYKNYNWKTRKFSFDGRKKMPRKVPKKYYKNKAKKAKQDYWQDFFNFWAGGGFGGAGFGQQAGAPEPQKVWPEPKPDGVPYAPDVLDDMIKDCEQHNNFNTCYHIMGLPNTASDEEVQKQYKKLIVKWHPDKPTGDVLYSSAITTAKNKLIGKYREGMKYDNTTKFQ